MISGKYVLDKRGDKDQILATTIYQCVEIWQHVVVKRLHRRVERLRTEENAEEAARLEAHDHATLVGITDFFTHLFQQRFR